MRERPFNVLFLCTGNSARSILAECYLNAAGRGALKAYSAGSFLKGDVHPLSIETLRAHAISCGGVRSKSWDEFATADAPRMDLVITVCDNAAGEVCPIWPGAPAKAHWSFPDPAAATGSPAERLARFGSIFADIRSSIDRLVALSPQDLAPDVLRARVAAIGPN